jgi:hypothetical protein
MNLTFKRLLWPVGAGFLGAAFLAGVYLGLVSLAQGPTHALELFGQDRVFVLPILLGFGVQVGLYALLRTGLHLPPGVPASAPPPRAAVCRPWLWRPAAPTMSLRRCPCWD